MSKKVFASKDSNTFFIDIKNKNAIIKRNKNNYKKGIKNDK